MKFLSKIKLFHSRKCIWKCCLQVAILPRGRRVNYVLIEICASHLQSNSNSTQSMKNGQIKKHHRCRKKKQSEVAKFTHWQPAKNVICTPPTNDKAEWAYTDSYIKCPNCTKFEGFTLKNYVRDAENVKTVYWVIMHKLMLIFLL